ncbi:MAG: hypothetical protein ABI140_07860 [Jatrophihabitantaceae bacterium]
MSEDRLSDISGLSPEEQEMVKWARKDFERIQAIPADQRGRLAPGKQADPIGIGPDGEFFPSGKGDDDEDRPEASS